MSKPLPKIIAVVGTTASGKSDLALELAKEFNGEIISVDSRQIYKEMDIGTNKETGELVKRSDAINRVATLNHSSGFGNQEIEDKLEEMKSPISLEYALSNVYDVQGIPHYMISVVRPDQVLTLAHFQLLAFGIIDDILTRGKIPILVGGTSLYTSAIAENWSIPDVQPDENLRRELEALDEVELIKRLDKAAPAKTKKIDLFNRRRVIRAIEIAEQSKMVKSPSKLEPKYETLYLAPLPPSVPRRTRDISPPSTSSGQALAGGESVDRESLYQRINERVDTMVENGLIDEVKAVGEKYGYNTVAMTGHAYQQIGKYLQGEWSLDQAIEESKKVTRHYAKRQLTWWKKYGDVRWVQNKNEAVSLVKDFLA